MELLLNHQIKQVPKSQTLMPLLNWLREEQQLTASKEGCGAGDCGACSLLVGRLVGQGMHYEVVNACLIPLGSMANCHIVTLEGIGIDGLHPVQQALLEAHASQCGFCTPGIAMAMVAWWLNTPPNDLSNDALRLQHRQTFTQALSGNLCRCTGYEPILKAAASLAPTCLGGDLQGLHLGGLSQAEVITWLAGMVPLKSHDGDVYRRPKNAQQLALAFDAMPTARLLTGATDVGLEVTQQLQQHQAYIDLSHMRELTAIETVEGELRIGAAVTFSQLEDYFHSHTGGMSGGWLQLLELIGSRQVRNRGTLGGNIANGSPIADSPPLLLALDARLLLMQGTQQRWVKLADFFLGYRQTALQEREIIAQICIPKIAEASQVWVSKVSKRQEDDISTVCMAMYIEANEQGIANCRVALGGMAATPVLATKVAQLAQAGVTDRASLLAGLAEQFTPLDDVRGSAQYRLQVCANTLAYWLQQEVSDAKITSAS